uniref:Large ribosomal subunit protein uL3c n=1 Tax=Tisochrysis lutea TaxID=1321669 RepID=A0A3S6R2W3_9EUKA|nr:ribosomal protein L3 [Tisochrysis lutea]AUM82539.1 ribosomal protein L3 [Tisochrysis lutea]
MTTIGIFGKKIGMTQTFDSNGEVVPVTLVKADACQICQIKTVETDGYNAIQVGYIAEKLSKISKPLQGHLEKSGAKGYRKFGEFRVDNPDDYTLGVELTAASFSPGQKVRVTGTSTGKGFAGNQKRHNFSRGPMTHGSKNHRLPGSIGAGSTPGRVYPGKKMAGQLGNKKITIKNSEILFVSSEENILVLKGSLPGKVKNILKISVTG